MVALVRTKSFQGTFEGNNYNITGLYLNRPADKYTGLFGFVENGIVRNFSIVDSYFYGYVSTGSLAGDMKDSVAENIYGFNITVDGGQNTGGFVGDSIRGNYSNIHLSEINVTTHVVGYEHTGGLIGETIYGGYIENCSVEGSVKGLESYVGGLVGYSQGEINRSYSTGTVQGDSYVGGLVGIVTSGSSPIG